MRARLPGEAARAPGNGVRARASTSRSVGRARYGIGVSRTVQWLLAPRLTAGTREQLLLDPRRVLRDPRVSRFEMDARRLSHHHLPGHLGVDRAVIGIGAGLAEGV